MLQQVTGIIPLVIKNGPPKICQTTEKEKYVVKIINYEIGITVIIFILIPRLRTKIEYTVYE